MVVLWLTLLVLLIVATRFILAQFWLLRHPLRAVRYAWRYLNHTWLQVKPASAPPSYTNNHLRLLPRGEALLEAYLTQIAQAQHSIRWSVMLFRPDSAGTQLAEALIAAAQRGVRVELVCSRNYVRQMDARSHPTLGLAEFDALMQRLRAAGVRLAEADNALQHDPKPMQEAARHAWHALDAVICLPRNHYDHRKVFIGDDAIAIVASANVGDEYLYRQATEGIAQWWDMGIMIEGGAVDGLCAEFDLYWELYAGAPIVPARHAKPTAKAGGVEVQVLMQRPGLDEIGAALLQAIRAAKHSIAVAVPYFTHAGLIDALCTAAQRGVVVRVYFPYQHNDVPLYKPFFAHHTARLLASGVHVFANHQRMVHSKLMVVDGRWMCLGSFNWNNRSYYHDYELNVAFADEALAAQAERDVFARYEAVATRLEAPMVDALTGFKGWFLQRWVAPFI